MEVSKLISLYSDEKNYFLFDEEKLNIEKAKEIINKDFILYHIEEITFQEDSPRKESFENVISSLRIPGINFLYLILGDKSGVRFYFGVVKNRNYNKELEIDIDEIGDEILKPSIEGNFRGSKISDVQSKKSSISSEISNMKYFGRLEGVPGIDEKGEDNQGVDRIVDVMIGDDFGISILASALSHKEILEIETSLYSTYNNLFPFSKQSHQKSISETKGSNYSSSSSKGKNEGSSTGKSTNTKHSEDISSSENGGTQKGSSTQDTTSNGTNYSKTEGDTTSNETSSKQINEFFKYMDEIIFKRLDYGKSKGLFNTGIYLFAKKKTTLLKLGNTMKSIFSGATGNKVPLNFIFLQDEIQISAIKSFQFPIVSLKNPSESNFEARRMLLQNVKKGTFDLGNWMSSQELSLIAGLPQKEVVGLALREEIEFGLNVEKNRTEDENYLNLGNLVRSGNILDIPFSIDKNNLDKHTFITGVTGSGKTTTCQKILLSSNMPFMVIEPAKTEYRTLTNIFDDILIFTLGNDSIAPFRLNPFEFFPHENISSRVDMIKASIEAAFDMEAAIPQLIEECIYQCYEDYGWNISTNSNSNYENRLDAFKDGVFSFPTLSDLVNKVEKVVARKGFDDRLKNDYVGSIKARLQGLLVGSKGLMLNTKRSVNFQQLVERKVILELEEIKSGSEKSLIMGFILTNLNESIKAKYLEYKKVGSVFKHITLIEEAHRLLAKFSPGDSPNKKQGVEVFTDMLAEVRKYGEALIIVDQIPNKLTSEVLKNTNTKIVHKLFAKDDKEAIGDTMSLKDEQKDFLSNLETGRAIISSGGLAKPIQVQIKEVDELSTTKSDIVSDEIIRENILKFYQVNYKLGAIEGLQDYETIPTIEEVKGYVDFIQNIDLFMKRWKEEFCIEGKTFCSNFNFKDYIENRHLESKLDFIAEYIYSKLYKDNDNKIDIPTKEVRIEYTLAFLKSGVKKKYTNDVLTKY